MKLAVIGTGYVGLVTGTCFAEMGNNVTCVDVNEQKVTQLQNGKIPIFEPGLDIYYERNRKEGRLTFTTKLAEATVDSQIIFLALPTPPGEDGSADLSYILGVAKDLAPLLNEYKVIVNKSTVPVGTADKVRAILEAEGKVAGVDFDVVSNPEFLREGVAVEDFMKPERVVVGTTSDKARVLMQNLYEPFVRNGNPVIFMDERSSEMTKYAANAFLATKITFMNEIANLCDKVGANVDEIRKGMGTDSRIGKQFLYAGIGFGGSCFPKDVQALQKTATDYAYDFKILDAVLQVNKTQQTKLVSVLEEKLGSLQGKHIAVWGLAFKANTDDVREASSIASIKEMLALGATVTGYDPEANHTTKFILGDSITYATDKYSALQGADALLICTEWNEFRRPDFDFVRQALKQPIVLDGRNLYNPQELKTLGFTYESIGRPTQ